MPARRWQLTTVRIPFLRLHSDYREVAQDVRRRFDAVLESQCFVLGSQTAELEDRLAALVGGRAVACSSGSEALCLALSALGVGSGDAVVVPALTFYATAGAVCRVGARPVFADVAAETLTMGVRELEAVLDREFITRDGRLATRGGGHLLKAVIPVHLYGFPVPVAELRRVLDGRGVALIEDAAQAVGAVAGGGRVGMLGDAGCFSFYPTKNLGGAGDGGAVTTASETTAAAVRRLRVHGAGEDPMVHVVRGVNARMSELQAAYLNAKFDRLEAWTERRRRIAGRYRERLSPLADAGLLRLPPAAEGHVYHQFTVRVSGDRDGLAAELSRRGIETRVFYPLPLHREPSLAEFAGAGITLPVCEQAVREILSLPIYPSLRDEEVDCVCDRLAGALGVAL